MKLTVLNDNCCARSGGLLSEWGLSFFIEHQGIKILFDTAYSGIYKDNAAKLGIDLDKTDWVILSHHHDDHARGLQFHNFSEKHKFLCHPELLERLEKETKEKIKKDFEIIVSKNPYKITEEIIFLGEIPKSNNFESGIYIKSSDLAKGINKGERIKEDSALAIKTSGGVIVITGCSHSGICNICEYAKGITGQKISAVIGGFHLLDQEKEETIRKTIEYFVKEKIPHLYPMYCVGFKALSMMVSKLKITKIGTGDSVEL